MSNVIRKCFSSARKSSIKHFFDLMFFSTDQRNDDKCFICQEGNSNYKLIRTTPTTYASFKRFYTIRKKYNIMDKLKSARCPAYKHELRHHSAPCYSNFGKINKAYLEECKPLEGRENSRKEENLPDEPRNHVELKDNPDDESDSDQSLHEYDCHIYTDHRQSTANKKENRVMLQDKRLVSFF